MDLSTESAVKTSAGLLTIPGMKFHRLRKAVQVICVVIFILLPLFKVIRFDLPHQRFYFFGAELWISEFSIIFFSLMFMMVWIASVAMVYGRVWCGYLCPQMIFSEAANLLQNNLRSFVNRKLYKMSKPRSNYLVVVLFSLALLPAAVFLSFIFISYFIDPIDLFHRLMHLDLRTAGGIMGASVTLVILLDFAFLRQKFCISICPYGYLQSMLADKHTLLVNYEDPAGECISCKNCIRTCPMGIDIRMSNHQIECIHCGECIDACATVRDKFGKPSLINYTWGDTNKAVANENAWFRRLGVRDGKRVAVLVLMLVYSSALAIFISLRQPVIVQIMPDKSELYTVGKDGLIRNHFRMTLGNRSHKEATLQVRAADLTSVHIVGLDDNIQLAPGEEKKLVFDAVAAPETLQPGINHMSIVVDVTPKQKSIELKENFFAPFETPVKSPPDGGTNKK
jgi:cytochrome c oxidase accessory protein FixG